MHTDRIPMLALAIAMLIGALTVLPFLGSHFEYYPGDKVDARLVMFVLEHGYKWISGQTQHSFLDAPFFYPVRGVIGYSENLLGVLPFYAPWRSLGFDRETSFQIWIVVGFFLNFAATLWVLMKLRFHWMAALFGAYIFAFSQVTLVQIGHSQLHYRFAVPLAWYFLYRFLEKFYWKDLIGCAFFLTWQFYCTPYVGYFLALFLAAFLVATVITTPTVRRFAAQATMSSIAGELAIVVGFLGALAWLSHAYLRTAGDPQLAAARWQETVSMLPRPVSYLLSPAENYETGWLFNRADVPMKHEQLLYVGLIPWVCVIYLLLTARKSGRNAMVTSALVALVGVVVLTLYVKGFSLYFFMMHLPGVVGIRGVSRWIVVLLLPFSLAVTQVVHLGVERLRNNKSIATAIAVAAACALVFENHTRILRAPKVEAQERIRALSTQLPPRLPSEAILAYLQPGGDEERQPYELDAMLLAQEQNIVTVNGYSSRVPNGYRFLRTCADLKMAVEDSAKSNDAFTVADLASRMLVLGASQDQPCNHLNTPRSVQNQPLEDAAFRAKIDVQTLPLAPPASPVIATVRVTNTSDFPWRAKGLGGDKYAMRVGCRWNDSDTHSPLSGFDNRFDLPHDLLPGDFAVIVAGLDSPKIPGSYLLECDAVQELVHWFHSMGSPVGTAPVEVSGGEGPLIEGFLDRADAQAIAGWVWEREHPNRPVPVEIYDGDTRLATISAETIRPDLRAAHKGNGAHSFSFSPHFKMSDIKEHRIRVIASGKNFELVGSPRTLKVGP